MGSSGHFWRAPSSVGSLCSRQRAVEYVLLLDSISGLVRSSIYLSVCPLLGSNSEQKKRGKAKIVVGNQNHSVASSNLIFRLIDFAVFAIFFIADFAH